MASVERSPLYYRVLEQDDADQLYRIYPDIPRTPFDGCPSCGKNRGKLNNGLLVLDGMEVDCDCQDQLQRYKHYLSSGIGINYQTLDWKDFHGDKDAMAQAVTYVSNLRENIESGLSVVFMGGQYGVGKTFLATLVLKACIMGGYRGYMSTYSDMLSSMKAGWKDADYSKWYKGRIDSAQVLLIDDLGKELMEGSGFNNDFSKQTLDSLFRTRVQQSRPTIITTNMTAQQLSMTYGRALFSLFQENSILINVTGDDYRPVKPRSIIGKRRIY